MTVKTRRLVAEEDSLTRSQSSLVAVAWRMEEPMKSRPRHRVIAVKSHPKLRAIAVIPVIAVTSQEPWFMPSQSMQEMMHDCLSLDVCFPAVKAISTTSMEPTMKKKKRRRHLNLLLLSDLLPTSSNKPLGLFPSRRRKNAS
jgi:hypothetical protein